MKNSKYFLILLLGIGLINLSLISPKVDTNSTPQGPYKSKAGKFSIIFPSKPTESSQDVDTEAGKVKMYLYMVEDGSSKAYMVAWCDYDKNLIKGSDPYVLLRAAKDGVVAQFQATIDTENETKFSGYPAIDFTAKGDTYNTGYKLLLVKNRLYQVCVLQKDTPVTQVDIAAFIGSFKLI